MDVGGRIAAVKGRSATPTASRRWGRLAWVVLPSVALGVGNKLLLVPIAAIVPGGASVPFVADLGSRLTWSLVVCCGLSLGMAVSRGRIRTIGIAGLVSAPIAFDLARAVRKGTIGYLQLTETAGVPSPIEVAAVKGIEYACLGIALGWIGRERRWGAVGHVAAGFAAGLTFGGVLLALNVQAGIVGLGPFLTWFVNELLFPVGCALVIYQSRLTDPVRSKAD